MAMTVSCWGCRGSVPVSGEQFRRYGGGTTCYSVEVGTDHHLLIDCGTGALNMPAFGRGSLQFSVLITHMHWDHTLALPFFPPLYDASNRFDFYGRPVESMSIAEAIDHVMQPPWFPIHFLDTPAKKVFHDVDDTAFFAGDIKVSTTLLNHPSGVTAYRLDRDGSSLVVATDNEHGDEDSDKRLLELSQGADLLIYDAQYLPDEYQHGKIGWGHSTWKDAVSISRQAGVKKLVITSHDWSRTDDEVDAIEAMVREEFPNSLAASEGLKIEIP